MFTCIPSKTSSRRLNPQMLLTSSCLCQIEMGKGLDFNRITNTAVCNVMKCDVRGTSLETVSLTEECTLNEFVIQA